MSKRRFRTIGSAFFRSRTPTVRLPASSLQEMITTAEAALPNESGGILLGHRQGNDVLVDRAIQVPTQRPSRARYVRSHHAAQSLLNQALRERTTELVGWVGEWHSHPSPSGPSPRDLREISRLARQDGQAVALVVLVHDGDEWTPQARVAAGRLPRRANVERALGA